MPLSTAVPKPRSRPRNPRKPVKPLRKSWLKRGTKAIPKVNGARQEKRRKSYRAKLAAYRRSLTYKLVQMRALGRCEQLNVDYSYHYPDGPGTTLTDRCREYWPMARLTHHHLTYARFGGKEVPEDIIVLCDRHNAEAESQHPTRWHQRMRA